MSDDGGPIRPFRPYTLEELFALPLPDLEWAVDGILPLGALTMLAGREKAGKSLLAIDLCCSVALGETFLGLTTRKGPVIYVPAEENVREVRDRIDQRMKGRRDATVLTLPVNGYQQERLHLTSDVEMAQLLATIKQFKPVVVVLDPLRELHEGEENNADQMSPLLKTPRQIAHSCNTAIVVNHHMNKQGGARGSTALVAAVDQYWAYHTPNDDRDEDDDVDVTGGYIRIKGRYTSRLRIDVKLGPGLRWEKADRPKPVENEKNLPRRIVVALTEKPNLTFNELAEALGANRETVRRTTGNMLVSDSPSIALFGAGVAGDPFRFRVVEKRTNDASS